MLRQFSRAVNLKRSLLARRRFTHHIGQRDSLAIDRSQNRLTANRAGRSTFGFLLRRVDRQRSQQKHAERNREKPSSHDLILSFAII
ncbi:hypothetical protein SDC9_179333 [bioreactor metagenome]|uniref:Uncharacterized protein n=1 Tax=bioreactor metagenome TaxID=1076179 RepID=A0A645GYP9_9ZZZZ